MLCKRLRRGSIAPHRVNQNVEDGGFHELHADQSQKTRTKTWHGDTSPDE